MNFIVLSSMVYQNNISLSHMNRDFDTGEGSQYRELNVFKHPMFRRGDWEACLQIEMPREKVNIMFQNQAVDHAPAVYSHAPLACAGHQEQPSSPPYEFLVANAGVEYRPTQVAARSV